MFCEDTEVRLELEVTVGHRKGPSQLVSKRRQDIRPILSRWQLGLQKCSGEQTIFNRGLFFLLLLLLRRPLGPG